VVVDVCALVRLQKQKVIAAQTKNVSFIGVMDERKVRLPLFSSVLGRDGSPQKSSFAVRDQRTTANSPALECWENNVKRGKS
jgi:hypothetical protein